MTKKQPASNIARPAAQDSYVNDTSPHEESNKKRAKTDKEATEVIQVDDDDDEPKQDACAGDTIENLIIECEGKSLNEKITIYKDWASKHMDKGRLDYASMTQVLRKIMTPKDMSALWSRLKTAMNRATPTTREA